MRLFETLSIFSFLLAVLFSLTPRHKKTHIFLFGISLVSVLIHLIYEGTRWQMLLLYFSMLLFLIPFFKKSINIYLKKTIYITSFFLALTASFLCLFFPVFTIHKPGGKYAIGTISYQFIDHSRFELFGKDRNNNRGIIMQIWYPASANGRKKHTSYINNTPQLPKTIARIFEFPDFLFTHFKYVKTNAIEEIKINSAEPSYPVIIYSSGLYGSRKFNTDLIENLVSKGYIVAGIDAPGAVAVTEFFDGRKIESLPRNEMRALIDQSLEKMPLLLRIQGIEMTEGIIPYFAEDISFAIDCIEEINNGDSKNILTGAIDTDKIGVFGVSLGGIIVADATAKDNRIKSCLIMESPMTHYVVENGLQIPTMFITRDAESMREERRKAGGWSESDIQQNLSTMMKTFERLPTDGYFIQIPGMFHVDFLDVPLWFPYGKYFGLTGELKAEEVQTILHTFSTNFFDKAMKNKETDFLQNPTERFPTLIYRKK